MHEYLLSLARSLLSIPLVRWNLIRPEGKKNVIATDAVILEGRPDHRSQIFITLRVFLSLAWPRNISLESKRRPTKQETLASKRSEILAWTLSTRRKNEVEWRLRNKENLSRSTLD